MELEGERSKIKQHVRIESMLFNDKESLWKHGASRTGKEILQELEAARCVRAGKIAGSTCMLVCVSKRVRARQRACALVNVAVHVQER
jgi:hypothetical protein